MQAILTHKGRSSNSGHYVAWVKQKGDTWIECNDDDVRPIHEEDIMKLSGGGETCVRRLLDTMKEGVDSVECEAFSKNVGSSKRRVPGSVKFVPGLACMQHSRNLGPAQ